MSQIYPQEEHEKALTRASATCLKLHPTIGQEGKTPQTKKDKRECVVTGRRKSEPANKTVKVSYHVTAAKGPGHVWKATWLVRNHYLFTHGVIPRSVMCAV